MRMSRQDPTAEHDDSRAGSAGRAAAEPDQSTQTLARKYRNRWLPVSAKTLLHQEWVPYSRT